MSDLLVALQYVRDNVDDLSNPVLERQDGICCMVATTLRHLRAEGKVADALNRMHEHMATWHKHSGHKGYPVPHADMRPDDAYFTIRDLWEDTAYGRDRRELLDYLIEKEKTRA